MAFRIEHRIGVQAPAEVVWEVLFDLPSWGAWNPTHPEVRGKIALEAKLEVTEALPGRPPTRLNAVVQDWEPNNQILWRVARGPLASSVRYLEIEALSATGCIFANGELFSGALCEVQAKQRRRPTFQGFKALGEALKDRAETAWRERQG